MCLEAGDRLTPRKLAGVLLAFVGVVALFGGRLRVEPEKVAAMLAIVASIIGGVTLALSHAD